jgi:hypothetical protein
VNSVHRTVRKVSVVIPLLIFSNCESSKLVKIKTLVGLKNEEQAEASPSHLLLFQIHIFLLI